LRVEAQRGTVWVQIVTTQRVVEVGLRSILESASAPFTITTSGPADADPDVVLFDVVILRDGDTGQLESWLKESAATVIAVDRTLRPELGANARAAGVEWGIDLGITDEDLVQVIEEAIAGTLEESSVAQEWDSGDYLGQDAGLSRREAEVLRLVVHGLSNHEIAESMYISINSVKSYIRSAYRKIGANSRSQAVIWGMQYGFSAEQTHDGDPHEETA
jgi:DNA-binding NarL/FixJ family response regulator